MGPMVGLSYSNLGHASYRSRDNQFMGSLFYQQFLEGDDYVDYERYFAILRFDLLKPLPSKHTFTTQIVSSYAHTMDINQSIYLGDTNLGGNYSANLINSSFLLRGYPSGNFVGRTMSVLNIEYALPLHELYYGFTTSPIFFKDLYGSLFVDVLTVDGGVFDESLPGYTRKEWREDVFTSTGLEFTLNTTIGFHLPMFFKLGLYYGFAEDYQGGFSTFLTFGFGSFATLNTNEKLPKFLR